MRPVLFDLDLPLLGQVAFPSYLTLVLLGFLVATFGARRAAMRAGIDGNRIVDLALVCLCAGVLGARLFAVLTDGKLIDFVHLCSDPPAVSADHARVALCETDAQCGFDYECNREARAEVLAGERRSMCHPPRDCLAAIKFWQGGLTLYGGLLLAVPAAFWFCRRRRMEFLAVADLVAPWLLVGQATGRLGCFLEGCCYGAATGSALGVAMPGHGRPLHPTQLYEAAADVVLAGVLAWVVSPRARRHRGETFGWMLLMYGAARAVIEIFRDDPRGGLGPLSTSQLVAGLAASVGIALVARARRRAPAGRSEAAAPD